VRPKPRAAGRLLKPQHNFSPQVLVEIESAIYPKKYPTDYPLVNVNRKLLKPWPSRNSGFTMIYPFIAWWIFPVRYVTVYQAGYIPDYIPDWPSTQLFHALPCKIHMDHPGFTK